MSLPRDREEDFRIAILNLIQDQVRVVLDGYRLLLNMLEQFLKGEQANIVEEFYQKILKNDEKAKEMNRLVEREISRVGAILTSRENFVRLTLEVDRIADITEGAAFRIMNLSRMKTKLGKDTCKLFLTLGEAVLATLNSMRQALLATTMNSASLSEKIAETEVNEKKADEIYRQLDLEILKSNMQIAQLLLCREVAEMIEDISDHAERITDILRTLTIIPV
ncbi:MAG: DUF47 family protein [Thaumarchaeota archaeon]|jgi:uncharacterized protein Yka (UPF0111/DUF47 family)|nr:DUF47 family protein [Nitrososphaerota archaeon]MCL7386717.1 DUF47 family protein [Candidatus Wolframiiraptor allenii]